MLKKRIIACLDIKDGRTVKGVNFINIKDAGDPVELGKKYSADGIDELVFLDISATIEKRRTLIPLVERIARDINIPFTVGGGVKSIQDAAALIEAGADKISVNSAALSNPNLINDIVQNFGSQFLVVAIDTKKIHNRWRVLSHGGRQLTNFETPPWAKEIEDRGAGEILLTSMQSDGTKNGFELDITREVSQHINIPVIASGGAGREEHFEEVFTKTRAGGALAASIFHFAEIEIPELKNYLKSKNIAIR